MVDDADKRRALADLYRKGAEGYLTAAAEQAASSPRLCAEKPTAS